MPRLAFALALLLAAPAARAATIVGAMERLDAAGASGWTCTLDGSSVPSIVAYAGDLLLGVYTPSTPRPDMASACRNRPATGFTIPFDPSAQASFAWKPQITVYGIAPMATSVLLPPASSSVSNPLLLPVGSLLGATGAGNIAGNIASNIPGKGAPPTVQLFANGPPGAGTSGTAAPATAVQGGGFGFELPAPQASPAGVLTPIFGTVMAPGGVPVPLVSPLALANGSSGNASQNAAIINFQGTVAQRGSMSGITTTMQTAWMPAGYGLAGVSGDMVFAGNGSGFSEALLMVGTTTDSQTACMQENNVTMANPPTIARFWAAILKANGKIQVSEPVNFAVAYPFAGTRSSAGSCVVTMVAAGYVFLDPYSSRYTTTSDNLNVIAVPMAKYSPGVVPFGMGGEFRISSMGPGGPPMSTYIGIEASKSLALDGISGSVSAGAVTGAPQNGPWVPAPPGVWEMDSTTYYMPAQVCASAGFNQHASNGMFSVIRNGTAAAIAPPAGSVQIMSMPISSLGTQVVQRSLYVPFVPGSMPQGFTGRLTTGDCLVTYETASGSPGVLDVENQSNIYLRILPN